MTQQKSKTKVVVKKPRAPRGEDATFYNLGLEPHEDKAIEEHCTKKDIKGKQFLRKLVRDFLRTQGVQPPKERDTTIL